MDLATWLVLGWDEEGYPLLPVVDPARCHCQLGYCGRYGVIDGLCARCWNEYLDQRELMERV